MVEAKYTMLYNNWLSQQAFVGTYGSTLKGYITGKNKENIDTDSLYNMLFAVYSWYEIGDEDKITMLIYMENVIDEYIDYYDELIGNYKKEYDYALNNKRVITKSDKFNIEGNTQITNEQDGSNTRYDLPNKVVPTSNWRSTPSDITDNKDTSVNNKDYTNETTRDSTTTTEFNNEFIDLKNKYINQIRNLYREFAMKFKDCFYQVY